MFEDNMYDTYEEHENKGILRVIWRHGWWVTIVSVTFFVYAFLRYQPYRELYMPFGCGGMLITCGMWFVFGICLIKHGIYLYNRRNDED